MVNYDTAVVDRTCAALGDATRRAIVEALADGGEMTVTALAQPFPVSLPAVMKHLKVLDEAGLVAREKRGRSVYCRLTPAPLGELSAWLAEHERFWNESLSRLERYLEEAPCPSTPSAKTPASSSNAASRRRASASGRPGPTRRR